MTLSPSLDESTRVSFELKFLVDAAQAAGVLEWARATLKPDPFADSDGHYATRTLYLDTPELNVYNRQPGYKVAKYRIRRYGEDECLALERKRRRGNKVRKLRTFVDGAELPGVGKPVAIEGDAAQWFRDEVGAKRLEPACLVEYDRNAFMGDGVRVTLDRNIRSANSRGWSLDGADWTPLEATVLEMKFADTLPAMLRPVLIAHRLTPTQFSKYRTAMTALRAEEGQCRIS